MNGGSPNLLIQLCNYDITLGNVLAGFKRIIMLIPKNVVDSVHIKMNITYLKLR